MIGEDFDPERDMPEAFRDASPQGQRIMRAVAARLALWDEQIPCYFDSRELNTLVVATLFTMDFIQSKLTGKETEYLRDRFDPVDKIARDLIEEDLEAMQKVFKRVSQMEKEHPASIEAKKRIRERPED